MSPITYAILQRAAKSEGHRLGDWLDDLTRAKASPADPDQVAKRLGLATARTRFVEIAGRTAAAIRLLHDVYDLQPAIGGSGEVHEALWHLDDAYAKLRQFLLRSDAMPWESIRPAVQPKVPTKA